MLLLDGFEKYIEENELFSHDDKILLTVSGGVDSMVMMSLTAAAGYRFGVAHCNFQLRGAESDEDEVLVEREANRYGAEFLISVSIRSARCNVRVNLWRWQLAVCVMRGLRSYVNSTDIRLLP